MASFYESRPIVLVGLMGAGKTAIGRRLAARLGRAFYDADAEIEAAQGATVAEIFARHGEAHFRAGEKRVIARLLESGPIVLATGGGAFMDAETRAAIRRQAVSVWLRAPLAVLVERTAGRSHRPLLNQGDPAEILAKLSAERGPVYAQADLIVDVAGAPQDVTTTDVLAALENHAPPLRVPVTLASTRYEVLIGRGLVARAGAHLADVLAQKRVVIVTDETVARLHLARLRAALDETGIAHETIAVPPGEASKSVAQWAAVVDGLLARKVERRTTVIGFGGGVVGDLAGFAAAATLRGLNFVQIPTTLLAQVDSSVGGKTGINAAPHGKNLIGAFHQPCRVLADTAILATLPSRQARAGYAEIVKAGLIAQAALYDWCEANGKAMLAGDEELAAHAIARAVAFKAQVVGEDEREEKPDDGRALLNLGHTFGHALEAELGFDGRMLHGEAVGIGLVLAAGLSARLGHCAQELAPRIAAHLDAVGLPSRIPDLPAEALLGHMTHDKKMRDGKLAFVLLRGIGAAFTSRDVPQELVRETLLAGGAR